MQATVVKSGDSYPTIINIKQRKESRSASDRQKTFIYTQCILETSYSVVTQ